MRINKNQFNINFNNVVESTAEVTSGEFFAGGGGWSQGIDDVENIQIKWLLNHDKVALNTHDWQCCSSNVGYKNHG